MPWILYYWLVSWEMPEGVRHQVETLPHPNVHLAITSGTPPVALVHGVHTAKFARMLEGSARVFGVKFRAGGFRAFFDRAVGSLRGKTVAAASIFGSDVEHLAADMTESASVDAANRFFVERGLPRSRNAKAELAATLVELILTQPDIRGVGELAAQAAMSERSLQRLFHEYVGASPKWVILRYRMHEVVERVHSGEPVDWAAVAAELGYFDQSHLNRDFRRLTGYAPERYRRANP